MINLEIITKIENNMWVLEFQLNLDSTIPRDIFVFENTGAGIGEYQGVCTLEDYRRFQTHTPGAPIGIFGNKFLKYSQGTKTFSIDVDPEPVRAKIVDDVKTFKAAYLTGETSTANFDI
jgi:hypothetical protein